MFAVTETLLFRFFPPNQKCTAASLSLPSAQSPRPAVFAPQRCARLHTVPPVPGPICREAFTYLPARTFMCLGAKSGSWVADPRSGVCAGGGVQTRLCVCFSFLVDLHFLFGNFSPLYWENEFNFRETFSLVIIGVFVSFCCHF